jgi:hypothetical protein
MRELKEPTDLDTETSTWNDSFLQICERGHSRFTGGFSEWSGFRLFCLLYFYLAFRLLL